METTLPPTNPEVARLRRQSAQRKYRKRMRQVRLLWTIAGVLLLALLTEVLLALLCSPRFWVYRISATNLDTLTKAEVIRLMHLPPRSNYYRISTSALARRIQTDPRVASVIVHRGMIGALMVEVHERKPLCQLGQTIPSLYLDAQGVVFTRPTAPSAPVPVIEGVTAPHPRQVLGKPYRPKSIAGVLACLRELHGTMHEVNLDIDRVVVAPSGSINLVLRQGTLVYVGQPMDLPFKAECIKKIIVEASSQGYALEQIAYIKVLFANREAGIVGTYAPKNEQEETVQP